MSQTFVEILLFAIVAMNAALLMFIAGVLRKVMNEMDGATFKHFLNSFYRHSTHSVFMNAVLTIPFLGAIPYFYFYGFKNWWITTGLVLWFVAGSVGKIIKLPVFQVVAALDDNDTDAQNKARRRLHFGNVLQAVLNFIAAAMMIVSFIHR
jgi:hypothetical protein